MIGRLCHGLGVAQSHPSYIFIVIKLKVQNIYGFNVEFNPRGVLQFMRLLFGCKNLNCGFYLRVYLCTWGNAAASGFIPWCVNCWLKGLI